MPQPSLVVRCNAGAVLALAAWCATAVVAADPFQPFTVAESHGGVERAPGVTGEGLLLDGFSGWLRCPAAATPALGGSFTVSAWFAPGAYPFREAPLLDARDAEAGFSLGLDAHGRATASVRAGEAWHTLTSPAPLDLMAWHQVAAVWTEGTGLSLHVDGRLVGTAPAAAAFLPTRGVDWIIGRSREATRPDGAIRPEANALVNGWIDGALAQLEVAAVARTAASIADAWRRAHSAIGRTPLPRRVLPAGPEGAGPFGAFTTALAYYPQWDRVWRTGPHADVVVPFDEMPGRFVFWRGTSYIPHWVTENGIWFTNEFNETWGDGKGCGEPMSDKQCRYSRVAVIESGPARAVVHWRYALTDVFYDIARTDADTGWGDWTDEVYTIYPDGTAVRDITLHTSQPEAPHEWHEAIVVMGPGFTPERALYPEALTVIGSNGKPVTFSWADSTPPGQPAEPTDCVVQVVHTRSEFKPFTIIRPQDRGTFGIFAKEVRREVSIFPWWNHWPAAQNASDGRYAFAADRPSHASLSNIDWKPFAEGKGWIRKIMLTGLTNRAPEALRPLANAWSHPPAVTIAGDGTEVAYDPAQKAWIIDAQGRAGGVPLVLQVAASVDSPLENPCFILRGWGTQPARVTIDGAPSVSARQIRQHARPTLESSDLVVWMKLAAAAPLRVDIRPATP
jgi:hypothetical protein